MNGSMYRKLKLELHLLYVIYPLMLSLYIILFFILKGVIHYLYLSMVPALLVLGALSYIGISAEIKNNNINNIEIIHGKKYIYLFSLCYVQYWLLMCSLYYLDSHKQEYIEMNRYKYGFEYKEMI